MKTTATVSKKLTTKEVCERYRITNRTLKSWRDRGFVPFCKIGERVIRFDAAEVEAALRANSH